MPYVLKTYNELDLSALDERFCKDATWAPAYPQMMRPKFVLFFCAAREWARAGIQWSQRRISAKLSSIGLTLWAPETRNFLDIGSFRQ